MKKTFSIVLALLFVFMAAACAKREEPADAIDLGPVGTATPAITPESTVTQPEPSAPVLEVEPAPELTEAPSETASPKPSSSPNPSASPKPSGSPDPSATPEAGKMPKDYKAAREINKDVIGWIKVPNTNIDYPILYDKSGKFFYDNHDIFKEKTGSPGAGSIYTYYGALTRNTIVTGHNIRKAGTMFHGLHKVQDNKSSLSSRSNRVFSIRLFGFTKWEVFALYETKDNEPTSTLKYNIKHLSTKDNSNRKEIEEWIAYQKGRSEVSLDVSVTADDLLMTLLTCGDNYDYSDAQSRLYIFLKAVE